jgi:hypothetical protein
MAGGKTGLAVGSSRKTIEAFRGVLLNLNQWEVKNWEPFEGSRFLRRWQFINQYDLRRL